LPRALLLAALPLLLGLGAPPPPPRDFADPFVLREGSTYFAFATGAHGQHIQAARSDDLVSWTLLPDALPHLPAWAAKADDLTWAPAVLHRGSRFVLYYTARHAASGYQCISRAVSISAEGPYEDDSAEPFVCPVGGAESFCGAIDPSPFVDPSGRAYLLWKSDENSPSCRTAPRLWSQGLRDDGLAVLGPPTPLLAMDSSWERPIVEGPSMIRHEDLYYLFYSANWYDSADYAVGYATCRTPVGPCTKVTTTGPLLKSSGSMLGPGGQEFFTDAGGNPWMVHHAWTAPHAAYAQGGVRSLRIARVRFDGNSPMIDKSNASALAIQ
jgi:beta-xylosidase